MHCALLDQATAGGWVRKREADAGCVRCAAEVWRPEAAPSSVQGLIPAPDLETRDCEDWAAEAGVWPPVTICILHPRPMRGQDWGHMIWLDESEASVWSLSASSRQWEISWSAQTEPNCMAAARGWALENKQSPDKIRKFALFLFFKRELPMLISDPTSLSFRTDSLETS